MTDSRDDAADDQHWISLLAGQDPGADASQATRQDAAWMRAAMLAYRPVPPAGGTSDPAVRVDRLMARAERAGILQPRAQASPPPESMHALPRWRRWLGSEPARRSGRWTDWALPSVAAALSLAVAVGLPVLLPETQDVQRGPADQTLVAADPLQRQADLMRTLRAAGLDAEPFERLGQAGVDVSLPEALSAAQLATLRAQGLMRPSGPQLTVRIVQGQDGHVDH